MAGNQNFLGRVEVKRGAVGGEGQDVRQANLDQNRGGKNSAEISGKKIKVRC